MDLTVTVESVDRTNYVLWRNFQKVDHLNARIDTCTFETRKYGSDKDWKPVVSDTVQVLDGGTKIFAGVVVKVTEKLEGAKLQKFKIKCKDWTHYLDKRLVVERYTDTAVGVIINDIITNYTSGFTVANVDCDILVDSIAFNYVTVSEAIQMLAEQVNYNWYVDYDQDIHFFPSNAELAPFNFKLL